LASVETGIDIRDKRMREMLFEVANFPEATVTMELPEQRIAELSAGENLTLDATATLALHGTEKAVDTALAVTRLKDGSVQVTNVRPVIIQADDFGLARGVEKLREVAGLPSISPAVPADFTLYFEKK
ncbi:MAG TPA: YceI family protein, partial [Gammaproteobacteria bacterium]|nr:YceI family protein [Gammaproteobacteria bacterium]